MMLPPIMTDDQLTSLDRSAPVFREAGCLIARSHGLDDSSLELFATGSVFVFQCGERHVIKLFPPFCRDHYETELSALSCLHVPLQGKVPGVHHTGSVDDWPYIVMDRRPGIPLNECWEELEATERRSCVEQTADLLRALHRVAHQNFPLPRPDWAQFIQRQRNNCLAQQQRAKLEQSWLDQIPGFLEGVQFRDYDASRSVILHTEVMRHHLIVERLGERMVLNGLIDFEPCMIGDCEYDLASVCLFVTGKDTHLFPLFVQRYNPELLSDRELNKRVLAYILLHRYSNLPWFLRTMPQVSSFDECLDSWFQ